MKRNEIFNSVYSKEMRNILKDNKKKLKKRRNTITALSLSLILLLASNVFTAFYLIKNIDLNESQKKEISKLNSDLIYQEELFQANKSALSRETEKNKNLQSDLNESNKRISELEEENEAMKVEMNQTSKIELTDKKIYDNAENDFKSWMPYTAITDRSSKQYEIVNAASADENGLLTHNGKYCVALGSVYGSVGDFFTVTLSTGQTFDVIKADAKSDAHTTQGRYSMDGSEIEFIVDENSLNENIRKTGDISVLNTFYGEITSISSK